MDHDRARQHARREAQTNGIFAFVILIGISAVIALGATLSTSHGFVQGFSMRMFFALLGVGACVAAAVGLVVWIGEKDPFS